MLVDSIRTQLPNRIGHALETICSKNHLPLTLSTLWSVDPVNRQIFLLASEGAKSSDLGKPIAEYSRYLCGIALESRHDQRSEDTQYGYN